MTTEEIKRQVDHWRDKQHKLIKEGNKIQKLITDLQDICPHEWAKGISAVEDDAFASPYSRPVCKICGKVF